MVLRGMMSATTLRTFLALSVLTYMTTLAKLLDDKLVIRWHVELRPRQQPDRRLLLLPELPARLEEVLSGDSTWNIEETLAQQLDAITASFVAGDPLAYDQQFKSLNYDRSGVEGVWYLKTADLRLFGWFCAKDCFIASSIGDAGQTKRLHLYKPFGEEVVRRRQQLPLDEPKFVYGDSPDDVISNFSFSP
jgi:hypothetical protein